MVRLSMIMNLTCIIASMVTMSGELKLADGQWQSIDLSSYFLKEGRKTTSSNSGAQLNEKQKSQLSVVLNSEKTLAAKIKLCRNKTIYRNSRNRDRVYRFALFIGKL